MFDKTGCDAVMIARGALGNPFIFRELVDRSTREDIETRTVTNRERLAAIKRHVGYFLEHYSEKVCHREMKKHMVWYTKGIPGSASFRKKVVTTKDLAGMMTLLVEFLT